MKLLKHHKLLILLLIILIIILVWTKRVVGKACSLAVFLASEVTDKQ